MYNSSNNNDNINNDDDNDNSNNNNNYAKAFSCLTNIISRLARPS